MLLITPSTPGANTEAFKDWMARHALSPRDIVEIQFFDDAKPQWLKVYVLTRDIDGAVVVDDVTHRPIYNAQVKLLSGPPSVHKLPHNVKPEHHDTEKHAPQRA